MRLVDENFRRHPAQFLGQSLLAALAIMVALLLADAVAHTVLIAALGASAFIAFTMPHIQASRARYLVGGYVVGIAVGAAMGLLHRGLLPAASPEQVEATRKLSIVLFGGLAVGTSIFVMVVTDTEHPPAAGVALGLVVNHEWDLWVLAAVLGAVVALCRVRHLLRPFLRDLL